MLLLLLLLLTDSAASVPLARPFRFADAPPRSRQPRPFYRRPLCICKALSAGRGALAPSGIFPPCCCQHPLTTLLSQLASYVTAVSDETSVSSSSSSCRLLSTCSRPTIQTRLSQRRPYCAEVTVPGLLGVVGVGGWVCPPVVWWTLSAGLITNPLSVVCWRDAVF